MASPLFASLVSTSTTPAAVTNTVVFPPAPGITYKFSLTCLIVPVGGIRARCPATAAVPRPTTTITVRSPARLITLLAAAARSSSGDRRHHTYCAAMLLAGRFRFAVAAAATIAAVALAHAQTDVDVVQVRPNVYLIAGAGANVTVQFGSDGAVVVDAGAL